MILIVVRERKISTFRLVLTEEAGRLCLTDWKIF